MLSRTRQFIQQRPRGSMSRARTTEFSRITPLLVLAVTVLVLYFARELIIPFAFALTLAFLLAPAVSRLESRRIPRIVAVAITGVLAFTILSAVGYVVARHLLSVAANLPQYRTSIQRKTVSVPSPLETLLKSAVAALQGIGGDP